MKHRNNKYYDLIVQGETQEFSPIKTETVSSEMRTITPNEARHIIKHFNTKNRKLSPNAVKKYANDMKLGNWKITGEPIIFDFNGQLLNGQHRLAGVIESGKPFTTLVVYGMDPSAFDVIDNGKIRTNSDVLGLNGYDNPSILSSLVRSVISYETAGVADAKSSKSFAGSNQITKSQILQKLEDSPELVNYIEKYKKSQVVSPSVSSFCYWVLSHYNPTLKDQVEEYLDQTLMGFNIEPNTITSYLFSKLQRNRNSKTNKMTKSVQIANIIKGFRRYIGWDTTKVLQITWDGNHKFPSPKP